MHPSVTNSAQVDSVARSSRAADLVPKVQGRVAATSVGIRHQATIKSRANWNIWVASLGIWSFIALAATMSVIQMYRTQGMRESFRDAAYTQFSQMLTYVPLTPLVFAFVARYPIYRRNWIRRSLLYLVGGLVFTAAHIAMRGCTPYGVWDQKSRGWHSAVWDYNAHKFNIQWHIFNDMFVSSVFDDVTGSYIPVVLVAYVVSYYSTLKDRERHTAQIESQLTRAKLQTLKSQLQPHFLFNTMHSISSLMFTDVRAADTMMSRLSDLLRMSLEDGAEQITTLGRELEFVNGYLEIEKMRLGERLTASFDISPDTLDAQFPYLLLQPLVENAIQHGIAKLSSKGEITISSRRDQQDLWVVISDNGPGFNEIRNSVPNPGLGIRASQERLQTLYGNNQSLRFRPLQWGGTEVTIRVPFAPTLDKEYDTDAGHYRR
jgi:two-component system, LytTR family, sensor kinase